MNGDREIFTVAQAAEFLQVGPRTIRRLIRERKVACKRVDGRDSIRIHKDSLVAYVKGNPR